jgi:long-chain fatty acid transport protein
MPPRPSTVSRRLALALAALLLGASAAQAQIGLLFTGAGPVNRSMGGAATATALDATGALFWNPATLTGLPGSELSFGVEILAPQERLASSVAGGALGPTGPAFPLAGSDRSDVGVFPLPSVGLAYRPDGSDWTLGLGIFEVAGFGVNYPASTFNPLLTPQPPRGVGLGALYSELQVLEIASALGYQVTPHLSVGFGPLVTLANLRADPAVVASPDVTNGSATYPPGTHTRFSWGGGFQAGAFYSLDENWRLGASVQSPRWFEHFQFQSTTPTGQPRNFTFKADLPMVVSVGAAYTGFERWLLAADVRYVDFGDAAGLRQSGFDPTGAVRGLGWRSVWALSLGSQYQLSDALSLRAGYSFNQNPIDRANAFFNVAAPTILEHTVYLGASWNVSQALSLAVAYAHAFQNSVSGPFVTPFGSLPGTSVSSVVSADTFLFGATVRFGSCRKAVTETPAEVQ